MNTIIPPVSHSSSLKDVQPTLEQVLLRGDLSAAQFPMGDIRCEMVWVVMRDGVRLATDVYRPPLATAPVVVMRTPYGRATDRNVGVCISFARRGYIVVAQDCRGTGSSEPDSWDYYVYESEDGYDCVEWIRTQTWCGGFIGSWGGSYVGQTQWCMATHHKMSAIAPQVSGLGFASNTAHLYMFHNAYARTVGKGEDQVAVSTYDMERHFEPETMAGGYFNEPLNSPFSEKILKRFPAVAGFSPSIAQRWLWERYCEFSASQRAAFIKEALGVKRVTSVEVESLPALFGQMVSHDALTIPHASPSELCRLIQAPPLLLTGWYDWSLNDAFATWEHLRREALPEVAERARLIIAPFAHSMPGYHEGVDTHPELMRMPDLTNQVGLLLRWYTAVREGDLTSWPRVVYYLMGANEWRWATDWPIPQTYERAFYLGEEGRLMTEPPPQVSQPDEYTYVPQDPTPTVGGSILSYLYPQGSVDVSAVQERADVLAFTTATLKHDLDVVGPLRMILYASSSAVDTDFVARLSDVFPDGRAIQIQSGILRARYRNMDGAPKLLEPGQIERFEIDLWCTANRFKAGHRVRVDISSADFPHFDRHSNRSDGSGSPIPARQTIYHDLQHASRLLVRVLADAVPA